MKYPDELKYTKEHEWAIGEEGAVKIGITDYAQDALGDVVFVELPEIGAKVKAGETFGVVESVKSVSDLYSPITGNVIEVNDALEEEPELVNSSPYEKGWIIKIEPANPADLDELMSVDEYTGFVETL
jgi:glycine cleavage system H protein